LTNSGALAALVVDGSTVAVNDRILVKDQAASAQNGIYTVTNVGSTAAAWVLTRAADSDTALELGGAVVSIDRGIANGGKLLSTSFNTANTVGSSSCPWFMVIDSAGGTFTGAVDFLGAVKIGTASGLLKVTSGVVSTAVAGADYVAVETARPWISRTSAYTAVAGDRISANTTAAAFTITLPASPAGFTQIIFADHYETWATRNLTIARNTGQTIEGLAENLVCNVAGLQITLRNEGTNWRVYTS
jgi:hypothetical protein